MIIEKKGEEYDGSFRLVVYKKDEQGQTVAESVKSDMDDIIPTFYTQRKEELERLRGELIAGKISPISLFMQYQNMTLADLCARIKLSKRKVKKHLTSRGFKAVTVEQLMRYAEIFDVDVCDFFEFVYLGKDLKHERTTSNERLVRLVDVEYDESE